MAKTVSVEFKNSKNYNLSGRLDLPKDSRPEGFAIYSHCFTCGKNISAASRISKSLADHGIACLRFDFTGIGDSEGDFSEHNFSSSIDDICSAAKFLKEYYEAPQLLIGHSFGGICTLHASKLIDSAKAIITIASPSHPSHILNHFDCHIDNILENGSGEVDILEKKLTLSADFIRDVQAAEPLKDIDKTRKAYLIFHSPLDKTVGIHSASEIFVALKHPKSFVSLDYADHLISKREDAEYVAEMCYHLGKRYC